MKINCLIIDDEPLAREGLAEYAAQLPYLNVVALCKNALEAAEQLAEHDVQLVFLDINMPRLNGLDLVRSLQQPPAVIFTTAHREFALEGFELNAIDYLLKPISFDRFLKAVLKVQGLFKGAANEADSYFYIKEDGVFKKIKHEEILYVEGLKDYVFIHTAAGRSMVLISMKQVEEQLPEADFIRVHRSFIVSKQAVEGIEGNEILINAHRIPISKNQKEEVIQQLIGNSLWRRGK